MLAPYGVERGLLHLAINDKINTTSDPLVLKITSYSREVLSTRRIKYDLKVYSFLNTFFFENLNIVSIAPWKVDKSGVI